MPDIPVSVTKSTGAQRWKRWLVPGAILLMAAGILVLVTGNWNRWVGDRAWQSTDDAYVQADLTPLSTKVAGLVATVAVSDYQPVKVGDLLVRLRDDDFRAQVKQAEAGVRSGEDALVNNQRQKELQDARIAQADAGVRSADADIAAAQAGIAGAKSAVAKRTGRDRCDQSGRGSCALGAEAAGRVIRGRVCDAAKGGAGRCRGGTSSRAAGQPAGRAEYGDDAISQPRGRSGTGARSPGKRQCGIRGAETPEWGVGFAAAPALRRPGFQESGAHTGADQSGIYANYGPGKRGRQRTEGAHG